MTESNWAGNYTYGALRIRRPRTTDEAQAIVAAATRIRALGTRHSFNDLPDSEGELITLTGIAADFELDVAAATVTTNGGVRYGELAVWLESQGFALHNMGSLPHISVAGAISTGTHGSGNTLGNLSTAVRALEFIGPSGELRSIHSNDQTFAGSVVALGALGPITRVTLAIQPSYLVRQEMYTGLPWSVLLENFDDVSSRGYSVSVFTDWLGDTVEGLLIKSRITDGVPESMPDELWGSRRVTSEQETLSAVDDGNWTVRGGVPGPWSERLPHFRIDATPSNGDELQTEYFVAREDAPEALAAVRALGAKIAPALHITELRTVAADELWMSPAYQRDSLCIHFTWKNLPVDVAGLLPLVEQALRPFAVRPHWAKVFSLEATAVTVQYERFGDFSGLVQASDPERKFTNRYLERVLGIHRS